MPTYQYACTETSCANRFELVQSFTDPAASECPVCGGPVRKVYGSVGVVFKGSGFYRTDSRIERERQRQGRRRRASRRATSKGDAKPDGEVRVEVRRRSRSRTRRRVPRASAAAAS